MVVTLLIIAALACVRHSLVLAQRNAGAPRPILRRTTELLEASVIAIAATYLVITPFGVQTFYIPSESMTPALVQNDRILVNKLAYRLGSIKRNEVVVFRAPRGAGPEDEDTEFVKRVVGLSGDVVEIHDGRFFLNGKVIQEPFVHDPPRYELPPYQVPEGSVFVMGDNRNHSNDSHRWGAIACDRIIGRATWVVWPLGRARPL